MTFGDIKDLTRRTASHKILHNKVFDTATNPKYDGYQKGLDSMVYKPFDKNKLLVLILKMRICQTNNYQKNYTSQLLKKLGKRKYNHLL